MNRYNWSEGHPEIQRLQKTVEAERDRVVSHPLDARLDSHPALVTFMEHHVFAVWDFMSLLKSLQRELTCVEVPWIPVGSTSSRRLINDVVMAEESDELGVGFTSHFELYVAGMREAGANTDAVDELVRLLRSGVAVPQALARAGAPTPSVSFAQTTWAFIDTMPVHSRAAAFAFGREDLIPDMFKRVVEIQERGGKLSTFLDYLERHIEVDGEQHTPTAMQMLVDRCGDDQGKWRDCAETVNTALAARVGLCDGILAAIEAE